MLTPGVSEVSEKHLSAQQGQQGLQNRPAHFSNYFVESDWPMVMIILLIPAMGIYAFLDACETMHGCANPSGSNGLAKCSDFAPNDPITMCAFVTCAHSSISQYKLVQATDRLAELTSQWNVNNGNNRHTTRSITPPQNTSSGSCGTLWAVDWHTGKVTPRRTLADPPRFGLHPSDASTFSAASHQQLATVQPSGLPSREAGRNNVELQALERSIRLGGQLVEEQSGPCVVGMWRTDSGVCHAIPWTPHGFNYDLMDHSAAPMDLYRLACGAWVDAVGSPCTSCASSWYAFQTTIDDNTRSWQRVLDVISASTPSSSQISSLLSSCESLRSSGPDGIVLSMQLAQTRLIEAIPSIQTLRDVLFAVGAIGSYGCNTLVRVGVAPTREGQMVLRASDMASYDANEVVAAMYIVGSGALDRSLALLVFQLLQGVALNDPHQSSSSVMEARIAQCAAWDHTARVKYHATPQTLRVLVGAVVGRDVQLGPMSRSDLALLRALSHVFCLMGSTDPSSTLDRTANEFASALVRGLSATCIATLGNFIATEGASGLTESESISSFSDWMGSPRQLHEELPSTDLHERGAETLSVERSVIPVGIGTVLPVDGSSRVPTVATRSAHSAYRSSNSSAPRPAHSPPLALFTIATRNTSAVAAVIHQKSPNMETTETRETTEPDVLLSDPSQREVDAAALSSIFDLPATSTLYQTSSSACERTLRFVAPARLATYAFQSVISRPLLRRIEALFVRSQSAMLRVLQIPMIRSIFYSPLSAIGAVRSVRLVVPGASESMFSRQSVRYRFAYRTDNGAILNLLEASRESKRIGMATIADGQDPCDAPPSMDAFTSNAYYFPVGNCIIIYLGLFTSPILDASFDDEALLSRIVWIMAHELAHATSASHRLSMPYSSFLSAFTPLAREEGLADVLAAMAVADAIGVSAPMDVMGILLHVAQMFCNVGSDRYWRGDTSTHPPWETRAELICTTIRVHSTDLGIDCGPN